MIFVANALNVPTTTCVLPNVAAPTPCAKKPFDVITPKAHWPVDVMPTHLLPRDLSAVSNATIGVQTELEGNAFGVVTTNIVQISISAFAGKVSERYDDVPLETTAAPRTNGAMVAPMLVMRVFVTGSCVAGV
jgi:hypothetical protein